MDKYRFNEISDQFRIYGDFISAEPFGSGHINSTYKVKYNQAGNTVSYVFQEINANIFNNPHDVMNNVQEVLSEQKRSLRNAKDSTRRSLTLIPLKKSDSYLLKDENQSYWRAYLCIEDASTYDVIDAESIAYEGAKAFGEFQKNLANLDKSRIKETINDFHNTPLRYRNFEEILGKDPLSRASGVKEEIEFYLSMKENADKISELNTKNYLPERICHNDTKLNNVMIDNQTGEGLCVVDLDTVMPGLIIYDFGDIVRTGTCPATEDEKDLSKVYIDMKMFKAVTKGFIEGAGETLTQREKDYLVFGGLLITLETGVRFLTDYLDGDNYFKIDRKEHNLDRARTQMTLAKSIYNNYEKLENIVNSV